MPAGLYTKNNLSEQGLLAEEALSKLYGPGLFQDLLLFSFASRLESAVYSANLTSNNQIYGLVNEPISDINGVVSLRTKFITNASTFSDDNLVWFDQLRAGLDLRGQSESTVGCPLKVSVNGSVVNLSIRGSGSNYVVKNPAGEIVPLPATVDVVLKGKTSGSESAVVSVTVKSDGTIDPQSTLNIVNPGSRYAVSELLEPVPGCGSEDDPAEDKCIRYTANALHQNYTGLQSKALFRNERYTYRVRFSNLDGFFLYDDRVSKYVYLGLAYNTTIPIAGLQTPAIILKRGDSISSDNLVQLYGLSRTSSLFTYGDAYRSGNSISSNIREQSNAVQAVKNDFKSLIQNAKIQRTEFDQLNNLGTRFNIIEGKNIQCDHRVVFRDPDGVLDQTGVTFFGLQALTAPDQVTIGQQSIPGIWLWTGDKYQRVFSSDSKPFMSQIGVKYLSPAIFGPDLITNPAASELAESGAFKYSLSSSYLKPGTTLVRGFNTVFGTLIQNISATPGSGGFVYHRTLPVANVTGTIRSWPLFSYMDGSTVREASLLATTV